MLALRDSVSLPCAINTWQSLEYTRQRLCHVLPLANGTQQRLCHVLPSANNTRHRFFWQRELCHVHIVEHTANTLPCAFLTLGKIKSTNGGTAVTTALSCARRTALGKAVVSGPHCRPGLPCVVSLAHDKLPNFAMRRTGIQHTLNFVVCRSPGTRQTRCQ